MDTGACHFSIFFCEGNTVAFDDNIHIFIGAVKEQVSYESTDHICAVTEFLCDFASPEFNPLVRKGKDVAAAAVLLSAAGAVVVGLLVFLPHLVRLVG